MKAWHVIVALIAAYTWFAVDSYYNVEVLTKCTYDNAKNVYMYCYLGECSPCLPCEEAGTLEGLRKCLQRDKLAGLIKGPVK